MADLALSFLDAARAFRAALASEDVEPGQFARHVRNALARAYLAAALFGPPTSPETDHAQESRVVGIGSRTLVDRLRTRLGDGDLFVDVYDPSGLVDDDRKPIDRSLAQELVEIDEDLAEAIRRLEQDAPDALWDIRFAFENHWGPHALACLRPLHQLATYGVV